MEVTQKWMVYKGKKPTRMDDLGGTLFQESSKYIQIPLKYPLANKTGDV